MGMNVWEWDGNGNIMTKFTVMGMGIKSWEWEQKCYSRTPLVYIRGTCLMDIGLYSSQSVRRSVNHGERDRTIFITNKYIIIIYYDHGNHK